MKRRGTRNPKPGTRLLLGTRASNLALTQSRMIAALLEKAHRGLKVELVEITTTGDTVSDKPLKSFGGAGVFVKELESALLDKRIDFAVHSLKDLPTRQPRGLTLGAIAGREDTRDVAVIRGAARLEDLSAGSVIGTGSTRRRGQLKAKYPHLEFSEIRGNVETRIRKVQEGLYAATILARAGLKRLGLLASVAKGGALAVQTLALSTMLPAPGQGALAIECRAGDARVRKLLKALHNSDVAACVTAERAALEALGGGCHLPLGALGTMEKKSLRLSAVLVLPDGSVAVRAKGAARASHARRLGFAVAREILANGGKAILTTISEP